MLDRVKQDVIKVVLTVQVRNQQDVEAVEEPTPVNVRYQHAEVEDALAPSPDVAADDGADAATAVAARPFVRAGEKIGRNDPCPCGSGRKYKQCHGRLA